MRSLKAPFLLAEQVFSFDFSRPDDQTWQDSLQSCAAFLDPTTFLPSCS
jgi:hypothetical protein